MCRYSRPLGNDFGYEEIFVRQLRVLGKKGRRADWDIRIRQFPQSAQGIRICRLCGIKTVAITAFDGGKMKALADQGIHVPTGTKGVRSGRRCAHGPRSSRGGISDAIRPHGSVILRFSGKKVFVTGASRGIGRTIAQAFRAEGAWVIGPRTGEPDQSDDMCQEWVHADFSDMTRSRPVPREYVRPSPTY